VSQTEPTDTNSSDERIRKIYVKSLKVGETVHTVFRAARKEKLHSRAGKPFLSLTLVDRTGEVDGRVFEAVEAADQAFSTDDYLLVKGKVGQFHGKTQIVVERLERLDPGPIDAAEFEWTPAPVEAKPAREPREPREAREAREKNEAAPKVHLSKRLARLLENPQLAQALETFVAHLERSVEERLTGKPTPGPKVEKRPRPPKGAHVERPPAAEASAHKPEHKADHKPEPKRDPSLPEGLAFKPLTALIGGDDAAKPTEG
jgi:RecG-like helicase